MSTFGEIVEPSTRTAWEDWDENIPQDSCSKLMWQNDIEVPGDIQTLYILEGRMADHASPTKFNNMEFINSIPEVNLKLFRTTDSAIYVCALRGYDLLLSSEVVELLKPYITVSADVISFLTKPIVEYQTNEYPAELCALRVLTTSKPLPSALLASINDIPKLEQPNFITGVTAGVINLREIQNQSGVAIVCYMEHNEEYHMNELQNLLTKLNLGSVQTQPNVINSNLYI